MKAVFGIGTISVRAVFQGASSIAASNSGSQAISVSGSYASTTALAVTGTPGNYTLTGTVTGAGLPVTGTVSFVDTANLQLRLASGTLAATGPTYNFVQSASFVTGSFPGTVVLADFNSDGHLDIATTSPSSIQVLLGNGDGTFVAEPSITVNQSANIAVADFNGDGLPDLVSINQASNQAAVWLSKGDGKFVLSSSPAIGSFSYGVAIGDFNGDGVPDIAVGSGGSNNLTILLGKGDGTFTTASQSPGVQGPGAIVTADFNGDGIAYLAVISANAQAVKILVGNGDGTFTQSSAVLPTGVTVYAIGAGDFNGDGKPVID